MERSACDACLWLQRGQRRLSIAVKGVFALSPDAEMMLCDAEPLVAGDVHHDASPARSLKCAGEVVPYKARVDVTAVGHAYPPGGSGTAMSVRLAIYRAQRALLVKTVHVFGDRSIDAHGTQGPPAAFERMALLYERALRGDANPGGVHADKVAPNLVNAKTADGVGGFGPISRYAKSRRALLAGADRKAIEGAEASLPDDFDGSYYQAAPRDQRLAHLAGDEWIVLDGWTADRARLSSRLPRARAEACLVAATERAAHQLGQPIHHYQRVPLAADTLHIDADAGRVIVIWRGSVAIPDDAELEGLRVVGGVTTADRALVWPDPRTLAAREAIEEPPAARPDFDATGSMRLDPGARTTPFEPGEPMPVPSPWGPVAVKPIPQQIGAGRVTYADATGSTITLTPEERERAQRAAVPYAMAPPGHQSFDAPPGAPFEGTRPLSAAAAAEATRGAEAAPFDVAGPGEAGPVEAPEGAPFAKRGAPPVPIPIGADTMGLQGATPEVEASRFFHELPRPDRAAPTQRDEGGPAIVKRTTDSIPIVCSEGVWLTTSPWQHRPPRDALTVIVKATYDIVRDGPVVRRDDADCITGDLTHDDEPERSLRYPSDVAHFKPRADVLLVGHAYPPNGRGVATQVRFRFGKPSKPCFDRRVAVFGDRHYQRALVSLAPTEPQPFERIPLVYERAFGGAGFKQNPVGRGLDGSVGPDGTARLPNLEDPDDLITGPEDKPRPACLGPLSPLWPTRYRNMGRFSTKWLEERWPYFPDDFDWAHHQCAPPPQQTDYLAGNEPFLITGAHPEHTHLEGRLCGEKPRCFIVTTGDNVGALGAQLAFEEVKLNLDTAVFDTDAMTVNLVWRGIVEVSDELAPEIETFFLMLDAEGVETSNDDAYARLIAEATPNKPAAKTPAVHPTPANDNVDEDAHPAAARTADDAERARIDEEIEAHQARVREELRAKGVDVDAAPPELPPLDPQQLAETLRAVGTSEQDIAALLAALQKPADDDQEAAPEPEAEPSPRQRAEARLAAGDSFDAVDLSNGDLAGLDFSGRSMKGCRLTRANLSGATLAGANLTAADLAEATLEGAVLDGAQLDRADFSQARAAGASMRGVRGERCLLTGGTWTRSSFEGAVLPRLDFTEASFDHAVFDDADLTRARLFDSRAQRASFKRTKLEDALCDSLDVSGGNLFRVRGNGSNWEKANLEDATVLECQLDDANFMHARLMRANVSATSLVDARMTRMDATAAKFVKSNLMAANLKAAILRDADFTSANLYSAEVWKADLRGANLNLTITAMSKLHK